DWLRLSQQMLAARGATAFLLLDDDQRMMNGLEARFEAFRDVEKALRDVRSQRAQQTARQVLALTMAAALTVAAVLALFTWRQIGGVARGYARVEEELRRLNTG